MKIGLIGYGGIGTTIARWIEQAGNAENSELTVVLVKPELLDTNDDSAPSGTKFVSTIKEFLAEVPDIVVECAGHTAVQQYAKQVLDSGTDFVVISAGALADTQLHESLDHSAAVSKATLYVPAGALAGIDGLRAARVAGISRVTYTGRKPPSAWMQTPAEQLVDLDNLQGATTIFSGNAREAALQYPKNSNVAAIIALAGIGFDKTEVKLIADEQVTENQHAIDVESDTGVIHIEMSGKTLPDNVKTSALAAYSAIKCLIDRQSAIVF